MKITKITAAALAFLVFGCLSGSEDKKLIGTYVTVWDDYTDEFVFFSDGRLEYNGYEDFNGDPDCWNFRCRGKFTLEGGSLTYYDRECAERFQCYGAFDDWEDAPSFGAPFEWDGDKCFLWGSGEDQSRLCKP